MISFITWAGLRYGFKDLISDANQDTKAVAIEVQFHKS